MTVTFAFNFDDAQFATSHRLAKRLQPKRNKSFYYALIGLVLSSIGMLLATGSSTYLAAYVDGRFWGLAVPTIVFSAVVIVAVAIGFYRRQRALPHENRSGYISISDEMIATTFTTGSRIEVDWIGFTKWIATDQMIVLLDTVGNHHIIPIDQATNGCDVAKIVEAKLGKPVI